MTSRACANAGARSAERTGSSGRGLCRWAAALSLSIALSACMYAQPERPVPTRHAQPFDPRRYYRRKALFVREGYASYYGRDFAGKRTANGERFNPNAYTAAHRSLPFGTIVRVVRKDTGDWVLVRINDRGPYGRNHRIIDLSKQAARRLSMLRVGVARVRLEILELGR